MDKINEQLKSGEFNNIYLLYGEEGYLKKQYRDKIATALADKEDNMNYNYYEGNKISVGEVMDLGDTMPFFSERRVLVIENSGWFKKAPEDIEKRIDAFPDTTYVIFVENEIDKRNRLYKFVSKAGYASEMKTPTASMLEKWVTKICKEEGKKIEKPTIHFLVSHMGSDMMMLKNELDKLIGYCYDRNEITIEDVKAVCISQAVDKLYNMIDAISIKDQKKALVLYHDLLVLREPAMRILFNLTNHFRALMELSMMSQKEYKYDELASLCGIPVFSVKKDKEQAKRYTYEQLRHMVEMCQMTDQNIKTGRVSDVVGVELLIVDFSS
ncbi:MAG: DNA polymerase III subunit delta [Lachnospiraceae bacterium]